MLVFSLLLTMNTENSLPVQRRLEARLLFCYPLTLVGLYLNPKHLAFSVCKNCQELVPADQQVTHLPC